MSNPSVINLAAHMAITPATRNFLHALSTGRKVAEQLEQLFPTLTQTEQKVIATLVGFRYQGSMLPADLTLIMHMPLLQGAGEQEIANVIEGMVENGVLQVIETPDHPTWKACFAWPALERLILAAVEEANRPKLVGADGRPIG